MNKSIEIRKAASKRYAKSEKGREANRRSKLKYRQSEIGIRDQKERQTKRMLSWNTALDNIRAKCRNNNIPFNITAEYIQSIVTSHCPLLGVELIRTSNNNPNQSTIDRIIPEHGYVEGNVWIISRRANQIKNDATVGELINIATRLQEKLQHLHDKLGQDKVKS